MKINRSDLRVGDKFLSSHNGEVTVTRVLTRGETTQVWYTLHGGGVRRTEAYPSKLQVELIAPRLRLKPDKATLQRFAEQAFADLGSGVPEFGAYTQDAIFDTAGDALTDAGYILDDKSTNQLMKIAKELA